MRGFKIIYFTGLFFLSITCSAQVMSGKILFERRTNLFKKFKDEDTRQWIKEENKNKTDFFELYFNDTISVFKPKDDELKERLSWTTAKNTVYQNFNTNTAFYIKPIWGEDVFVTDSLRIRKWKITESKRKICGYECRKAIWQMNDSTRIYAWYTDWIIPSTGPESFNGLPGTILGLATEDGGVVYFAKSVTIEKHTPEILELPKTNKKTKVYTTKELKEKLEKEYGEHSWGKSMIKEFFGIW